MNQVEEIERDIAKVRKFLDEEESLLRESPGDAAASFFMSAKRGHLKELQAKLHLAKAARDRELLEIRLVGDQTTYGTIPLQLLAKLVAPLNDALTSAAYRLSTGEELTKAVSPQLVALLDLRLAGLAAGSTRLLVTGKTSPDLTGESILENALRHFFDLLSEEKEGFFDRVDSVGVKSIRKISSFLHEAKKNDLEVELIWNSPSNKSYRWIGGSERISSFRKLASSLSEPVISEALIKGQVRKLLDTGRVEIQTVEGERVKVTYAADKFEFISMLHLGQSVAMRCKKHEYHDRLKRLNINKFHFVELVQLG